MTRFEYCAVPVLLLVGLCYGVDVRIAGAAGQFSNVGLLQVRAAGSNSNDNFGSVCGLNLPAADVACKMMGKDCFCRLGSELHFGQFNASLRL